MPSKRAPVIVTVVPGVPIVGESAVTDGRAAVEITNAAEFVPAGVVTTSWPEVAPEGIVTIKTFAVADTTVAAVPLKVTVFCDGVVLKPVPCIVTEPPMGPSFGVNSMIDTVPGPVRVILRRLPTGS